MSEHVVFQWTLLIVGLLHNALKLFKLHFPHLWNRDSQRNLCLRGLSWYLNATAHCNSSLDNNNSSRVPATIWLIPVSGLTCTRLLYKADRGENWNQHFIFPNSWGKGGKKCKLRLPLLMWGEESNMSVTDKHMARWRISLTITINKNQNPVERPSINWPALALQ